MKKIIFLANCNSPHLDRWLDLLKMMDIEVEIWSVHDCRGKRNTKQLLPAFAGFLPTVFKYVVAGLLLRFKKNTGILHAHNTSGYGLSALLSGKKYIITTYGSEIFSASKKNAVYKTLIQKVLDRSLLMTSTSSEMKKSLEEQFGISSQKIHNFSLGVDTENFTPTPPKITDEKIWVINRRTHPHYNTLETIQGFIRYIEGGRHTGTLIVLLGDYDHNYYDDIKKLVDFDRYADNIQLVREFLNRKDLARYLKKSVYSVSTPKSDQLSSSILESMSCGTVPILSDLDSYKEIIQSRSCILMTKYSAADFEDMFIKTAKMPMDEVDEISQNGLRYIDKNESSKVVQDSIKNLYASAISPNTTKLLK